VSSSCHERIPASVYRVLYQTFEQASGDFSDTLIIEPWGYHMKDKDDKELVESRTLSDSLVLKFMKFYL